MEEEEEEEEEAAGSSREHQLVARWHELALEEDPDLQPVNHSSLR